MARDTLLTYVANVTSMKEHTRWIRAYLHHLLIQQHAFRWRDQDGRCLEDWSEPAILQEAG